MRAGYILAATIVSPSRLSQVRTLMRGLRMPGERRLHFQAESESRRRKAAAVLSQHDLPTRLYTARGKAEPVRAACLRRLVSDCVDLGAQRLVLESRGMIPDRNDRRVIAQTLAGSRQRTPILVYEHLQCYEEPALWIPDAVAWCYGAGGHWRSRISCLVKEVTEIGASEKGR
jgi:hypothetical protein